MRLNPHITTQARASCIGSRHRQGVTEKLIGFTCINEEGPDLSFFLFRFSFIDRIAFYLDRRHDLSHRDSSLALLTRVEESRLRDVAYLERNTRLNVRAVVSCGMVGLLVRALAPLPISR